MSINLKEYILSEGADIVGFADLSALPEEKRSDLPSGVAVGIALNPDIVSRIPEEATIEYVNEYNNVTLKLEGIGISVQNLLIDQGYKALSQTLGHVGNQQNKNSETYALLPHKTVAAIAGLGWISKSSLLISKEYGSAVRFISILTDAPLETTSAQYECLCGDCTICIDNCSGNAIKNKTWNSDLGRDDLIDFNVCRTVTRERGKSLAKPTAPVVSAWRCALIPGNI